MTPDHDCHRISFMKICCVSRFGLSHGKDCTFQAKRFRPVEIPNHGRTMV